MAKSFAELEQLVINRLVWFDPSEKRLGLDLDANRFRPDERMIGNMDLRKQACIILAGA